jgi:hypothetical protein
MATCRTPAWAISYNRGRLGVHQRDRRFPNTFLETWSRGRLVLDTCCPGGSLCHIGSAGPAATWSVNASRRSTVSGPDAPRQARFVDRGLREVEAPYLMSVTGQWRASRPPRPSPAAEYRSDGVSGRAPQRATGVGQAEPPGVAHVEPGRVTHPEPPRGGHMEPPDGA